MNPGASCRSRRRVSLPVLCLLLAQAACFSERPFPMRAGDVVRPSADPPPAADTRAWLESAHRRLRHLLPPGERPALLSADLVAPETGRPIDVFGHFRIDPASLESLFGNYFGLLHSAQLTGGDNPHDQLHWPGYDDVWIDVSPGIALSGRFGRAGGPPAAKADCIVILPGLFGHNGVHRTRDLANALRACGLHALALEPRGHGKTDLRQPSVYYTFGTLETQDLLAVSEWLQRRPEVGRTGLVGFCWGANQALIAAWYDNRPPAHPGISPALAPHLLEPSARPHFEAGIIAFSPVLRFEEIIEALEPPRSPFDRPVLASLQSTIRARMMLKNHPRPDGSLRRVIEAEFARSPLSYPGSVPDALDFLRLTPHRGRPDGDKLAHLRVPVLIVQAANDPLARAQDVADLLARTPNPRLAALVLPGGGHIGFAAYARAYYFSLVAAFFDPRSGPAARPAAADSGSRPTAARAAGAAARRHTAPPP
jgi:predicted alpha/beta-fold hydrolase